MVTLLHVPGGLPHKAKGSLKNDNGAGEQTRDERRVVSGDEAHDFSWPETPTASLLKPLPRRCAIGNTGHPRQGAPAEQFLPANGMSGQARVFSCGQSAR